MSNKYAILGLFISIIPLIASSKTSPNGNINVQGDSRCTTSHTGGGVGQTGIIDVTGILATIILSVAITDENDVLCADDSNGSATATATGGVLPYTYNWSNGATGVTINNLLAGNYTVTVTDLQGATATAVATISQPPPLFVSTPVVMQVTCNGGNNGSITANAIGGSPPYLYNWSNGSSAATISNLIADTYTVTVTDANQCTETRVRIITQPPPIVIIPVNLTHESCAGEEDGAIQISVNGGVNPIIAVWAHGAVGFSISNLASGSYTVTVTGGNGCTKTASYAVNPGITISVLQVQNVTCNGGSNGAISVNASGGDPPYTYNWSNGMTGASITGLNAGIYQVTVTDLFGNGITCSGTPIQLTQPPVFNVNIIQIAPILCFADETAGLSPLPGCSLPVCTYQWSNGTVELDNNNLPAGTYTVTVTNGNLCTATATHVVGQPPPLNQNVNTTPETGANANNGTATVNGGGGIPPYTYLWSNNATTQMIMGLAPGTYTVTVTDANGCTKIRTGHVNPFGCTLSVELGPDIIICEDDSAIVTAVITGAFGQVSYLWSNGSTNVSPACGGGPCDVIVTDGANCQATDGIIITEFIIPPLNCPVTNESMPGANDGSINCADTTLTYIWTDGGTDVVLMGLSSGTYCVTVTDGVNGCSDTECFNVPSGNCQLGPTAGTGNVPACYGDSTGSISLHVIGATAPLIYEWSNGFVDTTGLESILSGLIAGTYTVTVTDANSCTATATAMVTEPPLLLTTVFAHELIPCCGDETIDLEAIVNGGVPGYTYLWSNCIVGPNNVNLPAGSYTVTVTDANGCSNTASYTCPLPASLAVTVVTTHETATGANDGTAALGQEWPVEVYWSNGDTTKTITGLAPGSYCVTVTDINGCSATACGQVNPFGCTINVTLPPDYDICLVNDDAATVTFSLMTAQGNFDALWSDGSTGDSLQITDSGEYCVTVTDASGCTASDCVMIEVGFLPQLTYTVMNESAPGVNDGSITLWDEYGKFNWSPGCYTTPSIADLSPGIYCVTVTSGPNSCSATQCFSVQPASCQLAVTSTVTNATCFGESTGSVSLIVTGATQPVTYAWSNGLVDQQVLWLSAGTYTVTVTDAVGCVDIQNFLITDPPALVIVVDSIRSISGQQAGGIYISVSGGVPPYTYLNNGPLGEPIQDLLSLALPGLYKVIVTDAAGCIQEASILLEENVAVGNIPKFKTLKVYPVPTRDQLFIDLENSIQEVLIIGVDGRLYKRIKNPFSNKLDIGELESGLYVLRIFDGDNWYTARMVK